MYCYNCGKNMEDSIICPNCGYVMGRSNKDKNCKKNGNINGIISLSFGIISLFMCFNFMLNDISVVGMYTMIIDRLNYVINILLAPTCMSFITLIISLVNKNGLLNKLSILFSIISFFFIFTEIIIVLIY